MKKLKHIQLFEEIGAEKVLSAEKKQQFNLAAGAQALNTDGEVNQYGFDCVYLSYSGIGSGKFEAKGSSDANSLGSKSLIVDVEGDSIKSHNFVKEDVVKVIEGSNNIKAVFMKNMLCFVIPNQEGGDTQLFRGWIKTNDRAKVVGFLKKWDLFNKVNINDIMLIADKMKNLQSLKAKTGEIKGGAKKPGVEDINKILNSESENKAQEILNLFN